MLGPASRIAVVVGGAYGPITSIASGATARVTLNALCVTCYAPLGVRRRAPCSRSRVLEEFRLECQVAK